MTIIGRTDAKKPALGGMLRSRVGQSRPMPPLAARTIEVSILQLGKLDLTSPVGKVMLNMLAAVAELERDLLVEQTQSGLARAKAQA